MKRINLLINFTTALVVILVRGTEDNLSVILTVLASLLQEVKRIINFNLIPTNLSYLHKNTLKQLIKFKTYAIASYKTKWQT